MKKSIVLVATLVFYALLFQSIGINYFIDNPIAKSLLLSDSSEEESNENQKEKEGKETEKEVDESFYYSRLSGYNGLLKSKFTNYHQAHYELIVLEFDTPPPRLIGQL